MSTLDTFPPAYGSQQLTADGKLASYWQAAQQQQYHLSAPFPSAGSPSSASLSTSSTASSSNGFLWQPPQQQLSSSTAPFFSPPIFSPSSFAPGASTSTSATGSYFSATPNTMSYSFGLLQSPVSTPSSSTAATNDSAAAASTFFAAQQLAAQQQQQLQRSAGDFWSIDPPVVSSSAAGQQRPPHIQTASLHEVESSSSTHSHHSPSDHEHEHHGNGSSSPFSAHTPVSDDEAFQLRAVDESERSEQVAVPLGRGARAGSEHSDAVKLSDGKGTTIAEVLEEMGLRRAQYDRMTPAKKRQIRNKVSARAFRARKKSLVENLEATILDKDHLIESLRKQILRLQAQNAKLEAKLEPHSH